MVLTKQGTQKLSPPDPRSVSRHRLYSWWCTPGGTCRTPTFSFESFGAAHPVFPKPSLSMPEKPIRSHWANWSSTSSGKTEESKSRRCALPALLPVLTFLKDLLQIVGLCNKSSPHFVSCASNSKGQIYFFAYLLVGFGLGNVQLSRYMYA
jgi:hypothetical protein